MRILTRRHFGLPADPWSRLALETADCIRVRSLVAAAAANRLLVSIAGPRGGGKTWSVRRALRGSECVLVEPVRLTRERLHMGDVEQAIVRDLSDEAPRRSAEARSHQVRRILGGRADRGDRVVLILDDAHVLHHATVRAIKRLLELSWRRAAPLLGVVLVGQADATAPVPEVGLRSDSLHLAGLARHEAAEALERALGDVLTEEARDALAASADGRWWLDLQRLADRCLAEALGRGERTVNGDTARAVLRPGAARKEASPPEAMGEGAVRAAISAMGRTA